ncbi:adenylate cyclase [Desulfovibrio sp. X2]|uniref:class I adenylate cyclase n=1 Tax=Desulfovibrio sp. X2 TaxID=941449 RepID=UPI000358E4FF|nr:class I adenylate cyclase [Desulfovibrio sp. X2]EPR44043.1 adenylate cyclase [Desulfovibrio sp. X2]
MLEASRLHDAANGLRAFLASPPPPRLWPEIRRLAECFIIDEPAPTVAGSTERELRAALFAACAGEPEDAVLDALRSEAALTLFTLARLFSPAPAEASSGAAPGNAEPGGLGLLAFDLLPRLGAFGRILAVTLVEQGVVPAGDAAAVLAEMPQTPRHLLFNRLLLSPRRNDAAFRDFALSALGALREASVEEGARLLGRFGGVVPGPAFPLREALLAGPFGSHALHLASQRTLSGELLDLVPCLFGLGSQELAERLARLAAQAEDADQAAPLLEAVMGLAPQPVRGLTHGLAQSLRSADREIVLPVLETLATVGMHGIGRILAGLYAATRGAAMRKALIARLPLLPPREQRAFLDAVPERERPAVLLLCFLLLGRVDPVNMERCLAARAGEAREAAAKLLEHVAVLVPRGTLDGPPDGDEEGGREPDVPVEKDLRMQDEESLRFAARGRRMEAPVFSAVRFTQADFAGSRLSSARFTDCSFTGCVFDRAVFREARFVRCRFENCTFRETRFFGCDFGDCVLAMCLLRRASFAEGSMEAVSFDWGLLMQTSLSLLSIRTCRFRGLDLSGSDWDRLRAEGVEFADCAIHGARFAALTLRNVSFDACTFKGCTVDGVDSDDPVVGALADRTLLTRLRAVSGALESQRLPSLSREAVELAGQTVVEWLRETERRRTCRPFIANNDRRLSWGMEKLGARGAEFFAMVPLLLHGDFFDRETGLYPVAPPCRVAAYQPTYSALEAARRRFPSAALKAPQPGAVPIEAIYTIGSLGTIAQSEDSDVDYWLCCKLEELAEQDVEGLRQKCEIIRDWAEEEFGLEVYFFLMDEKSVRENNFGSSGGESSGTAQALMLKEEFYRSAVHVAGKKPIWWLAEPGAGQAAYDAAMERLVRDEARERFIDLGHVPSIPAAEFFGASLWQIVKALKSPFKSIMKFGLLEKYVAQARHGVLLCDRVKANILAGCTDLRAVDPYVLLFLEVAEFYAAQGDREAVELIKMSFFLKARIGREAAGTGLPRRPEEKSMRMLFSMRIGDEAICFKDVCLAEEWSLPRIIEVGARVNQFVLGTYLRVSDLVRGGEAADAGRDAPGRKAAPKAAPRAAQKVAIDPRDLTKLGRRIFSVFAPRKHKIDRLSFVHMERGMLDRLSFGAVKAGRGRPQYQVLAGQMNHRTRRLDLLELKRAPDLCWLVAWIEANEIYFHDLPLKVDYNLSPVIAQDVEELLLALGDFFPRQVTFETDIEESLSPERVVRAFFVLNLTLPRETPAIRQASLVYSTNWGEMFCRTVPVADESIILDPHEFLAAHVEQDCSEMPVMGSFVPERAACPGIRITRPQLPEEVIPRSAGPRRRTRR